MGFVWLQCGYLVTWWMEMRSPDRDFGRWCPKACVLGCPKDFVRWCPRDFVPEGLC
eukprot:COSAG01_NODE_65267_length_273_cov_39.132184_1_plen_55_part_01